MDGDYHAHGNYRGNYHASCAPQEELSCLHPQTASGLWVIDLPCPHSLWGSIPCKYRALPSDVYLETLSVSWVQIRDEMAFSKRSRVTCWVCALLERRAL